MVGVGGNARGPVEIGQRILSGRQFRLLNPPFDIADGLQILVNLVAIGRSQRLLQADQFVAHRVEQAGSNPASRPLLGGPALLAEQAFEDDSRMGLGWKGRRGR